MKRPPSYSKSYSLTMQHIAMVGDMSEMLGYSPSKVVQLAIEYYHFHLDEFLSTQEPATGDTDQENPQN